MKWGEPIGPKLRRATGREWIYGIQTKGTRSVISWRIAKSEAEANSLIIYYHGDSRLNAPDKAAEVFIRHARRGEWI